MHGLEDCLYSDQSFFVGLEKATADGASNLGAKCKLVEDVKTCICFCPWRLARS